MKRTRNLKILVTMLTVILSLGALVSCKSKGGEGKIDWMGDKVTSALDLNEDQQAKLTEVLKAIKEQRRAHRADHKAAKARVREMVLADSLNRDELKAMFSKKQNHLNEGFDAVYPKIEAFHKSLSAEQKKEAVEYFDKISKWHKD